MVTRGLVAACAVAVTACGGSKAFEAKTGRVALAPGIEERGDPSAVWIPPVGTAAEFVQPFPKMHAVAGGGWLATFPEPIESVAVTASGRIIAVPRGPTVVELGPNAAFGKAFDLGEPLSYGVGALAAEGRELLYLTFRRNTNYPSGPGVIRIDLESGATEVLAQAGDECWLAPTRAAADGTTLESWMCSGHPGIDIRHDNRESLFKLPARERDHDPYGVVSGALLPSGGAVIALTVTGRLELFGRVVGREGEPVGVIMRLAADGSVTSLREVPGTEYALVQGVSEAADVVLRSPRGELLGVDPKDQVRWRIGQSSSGDPEREPLQVLADGSVVNRYAQGCGAIVDLVSANGVSTRLLALGEVDASSANCPARVWITSAGVRDGHLLVGGAVSGPAELAGVSVGVGRQKGFVLRLP